MLEQFAGASVALSAPVGYLGTQLRGRIINFLGRLPLGLADAFFLLESGELLGFAAGTILGLAAGQLLGLAFGLSFGFAPGFLFSLAPGFLFSLAARLLLGFAADLRFGFASDFLFSLASDLGFGLVPGFFFGFAARFYIGGVPGSFFGLALGFLPGFALGLFLGVALGLFFGLAPSSCLGFAGGFFLALAGLDLHRAAEVKAVQAAAIAYGFVIVERGLGDIAQVALVDQIGQGAGDPFPVVRSRFGAFRLDREQAVARLQQFAQVPGQVARFPACLAQALGRLGVHNCHWCLHPGFELRPAN